MAREQLTDEERKARRAARKRERRIEQRKKRQKARAIAGATMDKGNPENRCKAKTRHWGNPCPMFRAVLEDPQTGKLYKAATCYAHLPESVRERFNAKPVGGKVEGTGGGRYRPTPNEVLRQMFEQEVTQWIQPYIEALKATKPVVVGNGRHARVEMVADHRTRQQAAEALWDRIYGKPKQQMEHSGPDGGAIPVEVPKTAERAKEVAQILSAAGAIPGQEDKVARAAVAARAAERN